MNPFNRSAEGAADRRSIKPCCTHKFSRCLGNDSRAPLCCEKGSVTEKISFFTRQYPLGTISHWSETSHTWLCWFFEEHLPFLLPVYLPFVSSGVLAIRLAENEWCPGLLEDLCNFRGRSNNIRILTVPQLSLCLCPFTAAAAAF